MCRLDIAVDKITRVNVLDSRDLIESMRKWTRISDRIQQTSWSASRRIVNLRLQKLKRSLREGPTSLTSKRSIFQWKYDTQAGVVTAKKETQLEYESKVYKTLAGGVGVLFVWWNVITMLSSFFLFSLQFGLQRCPTNHVHCNSRLSYFCITECPSPDTPGLSYSPSTRILLKLAQCKWYSRMTVGWHHAIAAKRR